MFRSHTRAYGNAVTVNSHILFLQDVQSMLLISVSRASYLIKECSIELVQTGTMEISFSVDLQENETVTLDISENITKFQLYVFGINSIDFISPHTQLESLEVYGSGSLYCPYDFLKFFPNLRNLKVQRMKFDCFPLFNSTSLTHLELVALTLPNMVIQPSLLILPNLNTILFIKKKMHNGSMLPQ